MCFQEFVVQITPIEKYLLIKEKGKKKSTVFLRKESRKALGTE